MGARVRYLGLKCANVATQNVKSRESYTASAEIWCMLGLSCVVFEECTRGELDIALLTANAMLYVMDAMNGRWNLCPLGFCMLRIEGFVGRLLKQIIYVVLRKGVKRPRNW